MGLLSAKTILTSICLFHITLAFFFVTNPATIADQGVVWLMGEAMGLPHSRHFDTQSPTAAFLGIVLGLWGLTDLVSLSMPEEISLIHHWGSQVPLRLTCSFFLTLYSFFFSASSPLYDSATPSGGKFSHPTTSSSFEGQYAAKEVAGDWGWGGDALKNRVFFTFMFVETFSWFWVYLTLKEEQVDILKRAAQRREKERDRF
ncbi:increased loss of mitochondrial DNA protein 1 [Neurospora intermedia]|uniref:Increased loss of mitochondrial DNA protein 1 n=1 Tax=Neurospora intermedia TaxID=5142 RepID=A0ABR3D5M9_NEUIN